MRKGWVMLLLAPLAGLAGCVDCVEGPPVSARGIATGDATAGFRGFALDITITDGPGGPPLPGAGVVVYYGGVGAAEWSGPRVEVGPDRVLVEPLNATGTPESREVLRMLSDADGRVRANVPGNRIVGVVAAKDGYTEEWVPALAAGDTGTEGGIVLPLYRSRLLLDMDAVWGPGAASTGAATKSQYAWDPHAVPFGETDDANRGYAARVVELTVTLNWTNGATAAGDLGIGVGPPADGPRYFADSDHDPAPGARSETVTITLDELREHGILGAPAIHAGAASDTGFVAPFGLPYTMHIDARFDTARANLAACQYAPSEDDHAGAGATVPAGGTIGAILALAAGAVLLAARR